MLFMLNLRLSDKNSVRSVLLTALLALTFSAHAAVSPVSHWRMGENDPSAIPNTSTTATTDPIGGRTMTLQAGPTYDSDVSATAAVRVGSTRSIKFFANTYGTNALIPSLTNNFGIELWVNPNATNATQCLAYNGNTGSSGWGLYLFNGQYRGLFGGVGFVGGTNAAPGVWAHVALVRDNGTTTLYVNGVPAGATSASTPNPPTGIFAAAAQPQNPALEQFSVFGYLDEIRVFTFAPGSFSANDLLLARGWVYSTADSGSGSLRSVITNLNATGAGSIKFLSNGTISLLSSLPAISNSVVINGPGTNLLTVSGNGSNRLFQLAANSTNLISGLTLASGFTSNNNSGAALFNLGDTVLQSCALVSNTVVGGFGGAVANFGTGTLLATNCTFANNAVRGANGDNAPPGNGGAGGGGAGMGGAIYTEGTAFTLSGCTLQSNVAAGGNGGNGIFYNAGLSDTGGNGGFPNRGIGGNVAPGGSGGFGGGGGGGGYLNSGGGGGLGGGGGGGSSWDQAGGGAGSYGGTGGFGSFNTGNSGGGGGGAGLGAGIFARMGAISVINCAFTGNLATNGYAGAFGGAANGQGVGGAIFVLDAALNLAGNTFTGNTASTAQPNIVASTLVTTTNDSGAGSLRQAVQIANLSSTASLITFTNTLSGQRILLTSGQIGLSNNMTIDASALASPVKLDGNNASRILFVKSGVNVTLNKLLLTNAMAGTGLSARGGGIYNFGTLTLNQCEFWKNTAQLGGGLFNEQGNVTLTNCFLFGNHSLTDGGAIYSYLNARMAMSGCTLSSNVASAGVGGAAIVNDNLSQLTMDQCTVAGNYSSGSGGAINNRTSSSMTVRHCTISSNGTTGQGGGIFSSSVLQLTNSIICGNSAVGGNANLKNDFGTLNSLDTLIDTNALLAPLGNYGGLTMTLPPMPGSPAIDAGNDTAAAAFPTDQRGEPRLLGAHVEIGAVEGVFDPNYPLVNVTKLGNGNVQFAFTNLSGPSYRVLASTNVAAPLNTWSNLGAPTEAPAGTFTFTDLQATNYPQRFYRVTMP